MNFARQETHTHEITEPRGGQVLCVQAPERKLLFTSTPLPGLDMAGRSASGEFPPAARSPARKDRSSMISGRRGTHWTKRGSTDRGATVPTARRGGGRGGTPSFPGKGRRTRGSSARTSTSKVWGVDFRTWFGRRGDDADCRRRGRSRAVPVRGGSGCGKSVRGMVGGGPD
jgi:hypothetical protein